jgi:hypothetical protein
VELRQNPRQTQHAAAQPTLFFHAYPNERKTPRTSPAPNLSFLVQIHFIKSGKRAPCLAPAECDFILAADFNLGRVARPALIGPALLCHQPILHGHSNEHLPSPPPEDSQVRVPKKRASKQRESSSSAAAAFHSYLREASAWEHSFAQCYRTPLSSENRPGVLPLRRWRQLELWPRDAILSPDIHALCVHCGFSLSAVCFPLKWAAPLYPEFFSTYPAHDSLTKD